MTVALLRIVLQHTFDVLCMVVGRAMAPRMVYRRMVAVGVVPDAAMFHATLGIVDLAAVRAEHDGARGQVLGAVAADWVPVVWEHGFTEQEMDQHQAWTEEFVAKFVREPGRNGAPRSTANVRSYVVGLVSTYVGNVVKERAPQPTTWRRWCSTAGTARV